MYAKVYDINTYYIDIVKY